MKQSVIYLILFTLVSFMSCKKRDIVVTMPTISKMVSSLPADPAQRDDQGNATQTNKYSFFSLKTGEVVQRSDSASTKWDIAFQGLNIIVNGGETGPGKTSAQVVNGIFDTYTEAPESGYTFDKYGSGDLLQYNPNTHLVTSIAGKLLIVKTTDNRYAKVEILSYYKDAPTSPDLTSQSGYYTFRYVYQPNDTRVF